MTSRTGAETGEPGFEPEFTVLETARIAVNSFPPETRMIVVVRASGCATGAGERPGARSAYPTRAGNLLADAGLKRAVPRNRTWTVRRPRPSRARKRNVTRRR